MLIGDKEPSRNLTLQRLMNTKNTHQSKNVKPGITGLCKLAVVVKLPIWWCCQTSVAYIDDWTIWKIKKFIKNNKSSVDEMQEQNDSYE